MVFFHVGALPTFFMAHVLNGYRGNLVPCFYLVRYWYLLEPWNHQWEFGITI
jgi:hypothetical protein